MPWNRRRSTTCPSKLNDESACKAASRPFLAENTIHSENCVRGLFAGEYARPRAQNGTFSSVSPEEEGREREKGERRNRGERQREGKGERTEGGGKYEGEKEGIERQRWELTRGTLATLVLFRNRMVVAATCCRNCSRGRGGEVTSGSCSHFYYAGLIYIYKHPTERGGRSLMERRDVRPRWNTQRASLLVPAYRPPSPPCCRIRGALGDIGGLGLIARC